jgi:hypothetical protein
MPSVLLNVTPRRPSRIQEIHALYGICGVPSDRQTSGPSLKHNIEQRLGGAAEGREAARGHHVPVRCIPRLRTEPTSWLNDAGV